MRRNLVQHKIIFPCYALHCQKLGNISKCFESKMQNSLGPLNYTNLAENKFHDEQKYSTSDGSFFEEKLASQCV